ncbi:MAG TPA: Stf0 family sulfotransferase [Sphingomonas sp.]|jgi:LPS sulfotransferase NodH
MTNTAISQDPNKPMRGFVICSEHRSGSTLLCQWLHSTGVLGNPLEYFARTENAIALERDATRLDAVLNEATTPNGVYGIKLFSQQFDGTMKAQWLQRLPNVRFIHLERRDLLGQAISLVRARQTHQFQSYHQPLATPRYDARAIRRQLRRLAEANGRWRVFFARNGLEVLWLTYEDMVRDPQGTIAAIAAHVGVDVTPIIDPAAIRVEVQRDDVNAAWRDRFVTEAADIGYLDHPLGKGRVWARRVARDIGFRLRRSPGDNGDSGGIGGT